MRKSNLLLIPVLSAFLPFSAQGVTKGMEAYSSLLKKVVNPEGVRWKGIGAEERRLLDESMAWVAAETPSSLSSKNDQLAFWINAHNLCVMRFIADRLPLTDVMKIEGFRDRLKCKVAGAEMTLNDLVSGILRPSFAEPRIHFALWWGARGGPRLSNIPYEGSKLDAQLAEQTQRTLSDPNFIAFDVAAKKLRISSLLDWYKYDFGKTTDGLMNFLRANLSKEEVKNVPKRYADLSFTPFDWSLDQRN